MKKLYIILSILICANSIFAQKLPQNLKKVTNIGYINGQVSSVDLTEMSNIKTPFGNIKCFGTVSFYPSENVKSFTPAASGTLSTPLGKITYKKNEPIVLYESGCIKQITPTSDLIIKTKYKEFTAKDYPVYFYDDYKIEKIWLLNPISFSTSAGILNLQGKSKIEFYENGNIKFCKIEHPQEIYSPLGNVLLSESSDLSFYQNESIKSMGLEKSYKINAIENIFYNTPGSTVYFFENGSVQCFQTEVSELIFNKFQIYFNSSNYGIKPAVVSIYIYDDASFTIYFSKQSYAHTKIPLSQLNNGYVDFIFLNPQRTQLAYKLKEKNDLYICKQVLDKIKTEKYFEAYEKLDFNYADYFTKPFALDNSGYIYQYMIYTFSNNDYNFYYSDLPKTLF